MGISENIKLLREKHNLTQEDLADIAGVSSKAVSTWETGRNEPRMGVIQKIADHFGIQKSDIIEDKQTRQGNIYEFDNIYPIQTQKIRMIGEIACGEPIFANEDFDSYVECGTDVRADFCVRAVGDSMINARIQDGDIVFIRQQPDVEDGEIAAVIIEDSVTLKRVYKKPNSIILSPENPIHAPQVYTNEELNQIRILGKAVAFQSDIK